MSPVVHAHVPHSILYKHGSVRESRAGSTVRPFHTIKTHAGTVTASVLELCVQRDLAGRRIKFGHPNTRLASLVIHDHKPLRPRVEREPVWSLPFVELEPAHFEWPGGI